MSPNFTLKFVFIIIVSFLGYAQNNSVQAANLNDRVLQSGHSLTDSLPPVLRSMVASAGMRGAKIERSTIPGSPMEIRWKSRPDLSDPLSVNHYNVLVLTERVSVAGTFKWHDSEEMALNWYMHALKDGDYGNGARTILYSTWVNIDSGPDFENRYGDPEGHIPWRERMPREEELWEKIRSYVNKSRPAGAPEMLMIPGTALMTTLYDEIQQGRAPKGMHFEDFFRDKIHLSDLGSYYIALAHYAVIYQRDPRGVSRDAGLAKPPTREQAKWLQELAWNVLTNYDGTGLK